MEKEKVNYLAIILAFCVVIAGLGCFWLGTYFAEKDCVVENKNEEKETLMTEKELDNLGKELFKKTSYDNGYGDELYFYNESKLDYNKLNNEERLAVAFINIPSAYIYEELYNSENDQVVNLSKQVYSNDFESSYKELFGFDKKIKYEKFLIENDDSECEANNDIIACDCNGVGGRGSAGSLYLNYEKTELVNNDLIVYTSLLGYNADNGDEGVVYNDYELINPIAGKEFTENIGETLFKEYGDKASKYKLTFNKDTNDNWYWVSTELVK